MNYFAHAHPLLLGGNADPYLVAGTAVPDWLNVVARRTKCRPRHAEPHTGSDDRRMAALARGIMRHHADDRWFHSTRAFTELSLEVSKQIKVVLGDCRDLRAWFLGHILVELLLDAELASANRSLLEAYYATIDSVDATFVGQAVGRIAGCPVPALAGFIRRFVDEQFLFDYDDDMRLHIRLNQVMVRVGLRRLPLAFVRVLPQARADVRRLVDELYVPQRERIL